MSAADVGRREVRLGLGANLGQFALLVAVNALVGTMLGQERVVVPLLAEAEFGLGSVTDALSFIAVFGVAKALTNFAAGALADRYGRKPVLVAGWLVGLPVPLLLMWAPTWGWVVAANVLLGVNQGLAWSLTVLMKIDLAGPRRRGLAMGLNEAAGYTAVALSAWATGAIAAAWGLRPAPFLFGLAVAGLGLGASVLLVRETSAHVAREARERADDGPRPSTRRVLALATWRDPTLASASRAGLVNNLNEGATWGLFPLLFASAGMGVGRVGLLVAVAPAVWGVGQLATGAASDRLGRKRLIAAGQWTQALGLALVALGDGPGAWAAGAVLLGAGTALAYPTLLAAVGDAAAPAWRGAAIGAYRLWRDLGFAAGAVSAGLLADRFSIPVALLAVAALTAISGVDVALRMRDAAGEPQAS